MPEPISAAAVGACLIYSTAQAMLRTGSAVSREAEQVRNAVTSVAEHVEHSQALFGDKHATISELHQLADECADNGWDGQDALAINKIAVFYARQFIMALPDNIPMPEIAVDPDGAVSLDWIQSKNRLISLSIGANNRIAYAWVDGSDSGHAVGRFDGSRVPQRILEGIVSIVGHAEPFLRVA